jgi:hypothetical protein
MALAITQERIGADSEAYRSALDIRGLAPAPPKGGDRSDGVE